MGRTSSSASSPTGSGTRLGAYPQTTRLATNYAASDTTLAESLPSSPRNQPPPYGDAALAQPPQYQDSSHGLGREKRHGKPLPKKTLIIRLFTSIFITFIVCLIVAAVVGRIHNAQLNKHLDDQDMAAHGSNGTRFTMMVQDTSARSTPIPSQSSMVTNRTATAHTSIARPTGTLASTYSCPYITASATRTADATGRTAASQGVCGLTAPFKQAQNQTADSERIVGVSLYPLKDCVIARTSYKMTNNSLGYRCALSCSEDGGPGIDGLDDGWKWRCG